MVTGRPSAPRMLKSEQAQDATGSKLGSMPHATETCDAQEEEDDRLIQLALDPDPDNAINIDFSRELEPGEKADDAIDFGDLSDDDLADEEDEPAVHKASSRSAEDDGSFGDLGVSTQEEGLPELTSGSGNDGDGFDDLFGDEMPSSPADVKESSKVVKPVIWPNGATTSFELEEDEELPSSSEVLPGMAASQSQKLPASSDPSMFRSVNFSSKDAALSKEQQIQQALFAMSGSGAVTDYLPAPPENQEELLASLWPKFERDTIPRFMDLLPPKKARYVGKTLLKKPKPVQPTKLNLELAADQEKSFRISSGPSRKTQEDAKRQGLTLIAELVSAEKSSDDDLEVESDSEHEPIGGVTWQDLQIICEDWDNHSSAGSSSSDQPSARDPLTEHDNLFQDVEDDWSETLGRHSAKRQMLARTGMDVLATPRFAFPSLHDPEQTTSKIAKAVILDLNDPQLLIDDVKPELGVRSHQSSRIDPRKAGRGAFSKGLNQRYNVSNDEAYDLLKENHQSKVRSTLGSLTVEHSMPAVRLQWPYVSLLSRAVIEILVWRNYAECTQYKTKLEKQEARSYHRPTMAFQRHEPVLFSKPRVIKRKHMKGKDTHAIFEKTRDLSLGDNSNVLLLEYSEEYPTMMSNFGMGSKLINYYRRKNMEDNARPKLDIGETAVLLPQDKSPFSNFGHIDPGQITPAFYNGMYRAPIFKQDPRPTDFLVIRNTTGVDGSTWFMRNIENIHVVGQEFPSVDVPGPHSRKVTTAAKNRLKMISYRRIRRNKPHRISVAEITKHFTDTTDMQNRQKMKEFMQFSKEHKEWEMRPGEIIPDEETIRGMVKPEDVCLLESMQVGQQHLQDAGFSKGDEESEDEEGKEGQSIEQQLAPWYTSRNFLHATQGKAMLQLHGEGDPSGRGEAFSFIKTSMKGGFKAVGESVEDKLDAKKLKELGGHSYNVARQQRSYEESIRRIWDAQKQSLSSTIEHSDTEMDESHDEDLPEPSGAPRTPRSGAQTPAAFSRRDDESASQFSKFSSNSQSGKVLRITRDVRDKYGNLERVQDVIRDPRVIRQYLKRRHAKEAENMK